MICMIDFQFIGSSATASRFAVQTGKRKENGKERAGDGFASLTIEWRADSSQASVPRALSLIPACVDWWSVATEEMSR